MAYRVFLSSTSKDLADYREALHRAIDALDGFDLIGMESFGARDTDAREIDEQKLDEADLLVGLMGHCYGSSPPGDPTSFTEQEYGFAVRRNPPLPRLIFVAPDDFPVPHHLIEPDDKRARQKMFRERVMVDRVVASFTSPEELATNVVAALANWRVERITAELVAAKEEAAKERQAAAKYQEEAAKEGARRAELERTLAEGREERVALRTAVQALADKAQGPEPAPKVEQALALLPKGRTAEARGVFEEIVARKKAEGTAALKEAAAAARHLGALAYLDSTDQAIAAYATATRLDPDHTWSWIFLGRLHLQAGSLTGGEQAFEQARADAEHAGNERDVGVVYHELGMVRQARGDLLGALEVYERYHEISNRLAAQDPSNARWQRDLSVSLNKIGDVQVAQGKLDAALNAYRDSLAIREKLATQDPGNVGWQRDLSVSFEKIGDVQVARGELDPALEAYRDSLLILKKLATQTRSNARWQRDLSVSFNKVGDVQVARGELDPALQAYQNGLATREKLVAQDPGNAGWQRDLSVSFIKIGDVQVARGECDPALQAYRDSLLIREKLVAQDPGNAGWQRDLWVSLWRFAQIEKTGVSWAQVLEKMEAMKARGVLLPTDEPFLEQARTLAASD